MMRNYLWLLLKNLPDPIDDSELCTRAKASTAAPIVETDRQLFRQALWKNVADEVSFNTDA